MKSVFSAVMAALFLFAACARCAGEAGEFREEHAVSSGRSPISLLEPEGGQEEEEGINGMRLAAVLGLGTLCIGGYAAYGFGFWWKEEPRSFHMTYEGNMEQDSYAGGSDKLGHAYACYAMTRGFGWLLRWTGMSPVASEIFGGLAVQAMFLLSEIEDAFFDYGFSVWDFAFDLAGSVLAAMLDFIPWLDRLVDFRFWFAPTSRFEDTGYNMAEDYSGQKYFLVFKLDGIPALRKTALRYLEVYAGYCALGYKPRGEKRERHLFFGVSIDVFGILRDVVCPAIGAPEFAGKAASIAGEYWHPHFVHAPVADLVLR